MRDVNSLNKVILVGHLGQNPELRYIPQTERAVANFNLATNERYFNPTTNESDVRAEWHRIVAWGKLAEFCEKYLTQGKQILIEGRLRTRSWQDRDGNRRYTTEVHAQSIVMLGKKEDSAPETSTYPEQDADDQDTSPVLETAKDDEEDVPF